MNLPIITTKQQRILQLLYLYRFLDRKQIQQAMNHADKRRVLAWLKDLREKHYVEWIYDGADFAEKTKLAIYHLGINGVRFIRSLEMADGLTLYPQEEVRKRYKDTTRSRSFIDRSMLVVSCCLAIRESNKATVSKTSLTAIVEAQYLYKDHDYHFLAEHEVLRPNLCIVKKNKQGEVTVNYLLEIFDASLPRYRMRYRLKKYVTYLEDQEWKGDGPQPIILLVFTSLTELIYAKRATKKLIEDTYEEELHIRFTTTSTLAQEGITANMWEEGRLLHGL